MTKKEAKALALQQREERLTQANELLVTIAQCGRHFFRHEYEAGQFHISRFELRHGRTWFIDKYRETAILPSHPSTRWSKFTEGGTLRILVRDLARWIALNEQPVLNHFGPWHHWYSDGDPWGYGAEMEQVRAHARRIGFIGLLDRKTASWAA